jgi:hypothetical protein
LRTANDAVGPENNEVIVAAAKNADLVIAAWGTHGELQERGNAAREMLTEAGIELHMLRLTKAGHPGHPLYVAGDTQPMRWA